ncbi:MAG: hypothetical protein FJW68_06220 [Actinobacteria bacterium]|nr:hypothetical protein [Actinomycetota bacterium]
MMNVKILLPLTIIIIMPAVFMLLFVSSCAAAGIFNNESNTAQESFEMASAQTENMPETREDIYLFDYNKIKINSTSALDIKIKNCNVYKDVFGDLVVLGEIENNSAITKTNMDITFSIIDEKNNTFDFIKQSAYAEYLRGGFILPFDFIYENRPGYINVSEIKIGLNYRNYNKEFMGYPVISDEGFFYNKDIITIKGNVFNLGSNEIEGLKLLCTFYDKKNKVVFIRECYLEADSLKAREGQDFEISVLLDDYVKDFTSYSIEVFFRDAVIAKNQV